MNVIFLDIDGVLNNLGSAVALGSTSKHFDSVSVALVARLCNEGPASIVISSSWRTGDLPNLIENLIPAGAMRLVKHIIGETPQLRDMKRGQEVAAWLKNSNASVRYVIIDDDGDMLPDQPFVKTDFEDGFRFRHYQAAMRILNPKHQDCQFITADHEKQDSI